MSANLARKEIESIEDLSQDELNCNEGTPRGQGIIENSIQRNGCGRSVLADKNGKMIAGNRTLEVAQAQGLDIEVVHTDGRKLVVVVRDDLDLDTDPRARELSIADNRASEVGLKWLVSRIEEARMKNADVKIDYMFTADEMRERLAESAKRQFGGESSSEKREVECPSCGQKFKP